MEINDLIENENDGPWELKCPNCGQSKKAVNSKDVIQQLEADGTYETGIYCCSAPGVGPEINPLFVEVIELVELSPFLQQLEDNRLVELTRRREMLAKALDQIDKWEIYKNQLFAHIDQLTPMVKKIVKHSIFNLGHVDKIVRNGSKGSSNLCWRLKIINDNQFLHIGLGQCNETINGQINLSSLQRIDGLIAEYPWNSPKKYEFNITKEEEMLLDREFLSSIRSFQRSVETLTHQLEKARVIITLVAHHTSRTFVLHLDNFLKCDIVKSIERLTLFLLNSSQKDWEFMTKQMWWSLLSQLDEYKVDLDIEPLPANRQLALDSNILDERNHCVDCRVILNSLTLKRCNTCQSERNLQINRLFQNYPLADSQIHAILQLITKLELNIED